MFYGFRVTLLAAAFLMSSCSLIGLTKKSKRDTYLDDLSDLVAAAKGKKSGDPAFATLEAVWVEYDWRDNHLIGMGAKPAQLKRVCKKNLEVAMMLAGGYQNDAERQVVHAFESDILHRNERSC